MGIIYMTPIGGNTDLDQVTVTASDVMKSKVAMDSNGNLITGTLALSGNATDAAVLSGKTYYNTDMKTKRTGAMVDRGAASSSLNCGQSYTISQGYHNGSGKITANSLASQTDANAIAGNILKNKTAWVKGVKITGTMVDHTGTPQHINARRLNNNRFEVAVAAGYHGYSWAGNSYEYMELSEVANTIGLTAAKLLSGYTVCGVTGTAQSYRYYSTTIKSSSSKETFKDVSGSGYSCAVVTLGAIDFTPQIFICRHSAKAGEGTFLISPGSNMLAVYTGTWNSGKAFDIISASNCYWGKSGFRIPVISANTNYQFMIFGY